MSSDPDFTDYASIRLTHHVAAGERAEAVKRQSGRRSSKPECLVLGHAWTEEPGREGGTICMICQVFRLD